MGFNMGLSEIKKDLGLSEKEFAKWLEDSKPVTFIAIDQRSEMEDSEGASLHELLADETDADAYELERRLGHRSERYIKLYTNPPSHIAASYIEKF